MISPTNAGRSNCGPRVSGFVANQFKIDSPPAGVAPKQVAGQPEEEIKEEIDIKEDKKTTAELY